ncbi:MAG TPA: PAS domain S-box protein [Vicinamibacteria bacterium]|nr:PAS domain S-box protein [Vicinamibacteria bacterium]
MAPPSTPEAGKPAARHALPAVVIAPFVFGLLGWAGVEGGAFGLEFALAVTALLSSATLAAAVWRGARALGRLKLEAQPAQATIRGTEQQILIQSAALNAAANAVGITDRDGRIVWVNPAFSRLTGYSAEEAVGQSFRLLRSGVHDQPFYESLWGTILAGQVWQGEVINRRKDGTLYHEQAAITPVRDSAGAITHFIAVKEDISARKQAEEALRQSEERLRQAQKREAIARLAGGVAHHFNNLLAAVLGRISLAREGLAPDSRARQHLDKALEAGDRAADLARQMLAYSGRGHFQLRPVDLSRVVQESLALLAAAVPSQTQLETALAPDLPAVRADLGQMQQLLMNLTINGAEAIGPKVGTVRLATGRLQLGAESDRYTQHTQEALSPGAYVCLEVADDGEGMDQATMERIFDPFFSTKFVGRGLGLAAVLGIVRGHRGGIEVVSVPGQGATVRVVLPATEGP